jgi:hypothetical protein
MNHYHCHRVWITETRAERVADTLAWFPSKIPMPTASSTDRALAAARDLVCALRNPAPASPFTPLDANQHQALTQLAELFASVAVPASPVAAPARSPPVPIPVPAPTPAQVRFAVPIVTAEHAPALPRVPTLAPPPPRVPPTATYHSRTRNPGRRRRKARKPPPTPTLVPAHPHNTRTRPFLVPASANAVVDPATGASLEYRHLRTGPDAPDWIQAAANEIGRLTNGNPPHSTHGSQTMHFIAHTAIPPGRRATYLRIVASIRPQKAEPKRIRFTVGGNLVQYPGKVSTPTADITTAKILFNSVLSTPAAKFMCIDIKDFYLGTPMARYEYMRIPVPDIPPTILAQYQLAPLIHNNSVTVEIRKGMYGLPQAGILAHDRLVEHLARHGYIKTPHTAGLFRHVTRPIQFTLVVDDFGVKYTGTENAQHLIDTLQALYTITIDWAGTRYLGLTLAWNYEHRTLDMSMPDYIDQALTRFQRSPPTKPQHAPHPWTPPNYGVTTQLTPAPDTTDPLNASDKTHLQEIIGTLLYYARAVDSTILVALGTLASAQSTATQATLQAAEHLLDYCATHPHATVRFQASDMCLHIHSDASYLSESKACSRAAGHFFLSRRPRNPNAAPASTDPDPPNNGAIHTHSSIMSVVLSSATEAELGALFYNAKDATAFRVTLDELGHTQPPTPIQTDNACASGIANETIKKRRSKAIDMRFYWVKDRIKQKQFIIYWRPGLTNLADYFSKHHSPAHHRKMRSHYLLEQSPTNDKATSHLQRGCVDPTPGKDNVSLEVQSPTAKSQVASISHTTNHSPTVPTNIQEYSIDS